jgi:hypothetical protein
MLQVWIMEASCWAYGESIYTFLGGEEREEKGAVSL